MALNPAFSQSWQEDLAEVLRDLGRLIVALAPYHDQAVLTGGLIPVLYRSALPDVANETRPLLTFDLDWTVRSDLIAPQGRNLHDLLETSGFVRELRGSGAVPISRYHHARHRTAAAASIYVEFLSPRKGGRMCRKGDSQEVVELQPGLFVQSLPYLGLLLTNRLSANSAKVPELHAPEAVRFYLPHPATFMLQKILIRDKRTSAKQDNDLAHVYDVVLLTRKRWDEIGAMIDTLQREAAFPKAWFVRAKKSWRALFNSPQALGPRAVARIYGSLSGSSAPPTTEQIYRVMSQFLTTAGITA